MLIRNPFEVTITYRNFNVAGKTGVAKQQAFQGLDWLIHQMNVFLQWYHHTKSWITNPMEKLHIVYYEDLKENTQAGTEPIYA